MSQLPVTESLGILMIVIIVNGYDDVLEYLQKKIRENLIFNGGKTDLPVDDFL